MKKNMGNFDRVLRVLVAITILGLFMTEIISGTLAVVLLILAGVFILTGFIGTCPLYLPFGFSTKKDSGNR